jgi:hypothetical protein
VLKVSAGNYRDLFSFRFVLIASARQIGELRANYPPADDRANAGGAHFWKLQTELGRRCPLSRVMGEGDMDPVITGSSATPTPSRPALRRKIALAALGELAVGCQAGGAANQGVRGVVGAMGQLVLEDTFCRAIEETDAGRPGARGRNSGREASRGMGGRNATGERDAARRCGGIPGVRAQRSPPSITS